MKTSVFATSNNIKKLSAPLLSRFFIVEIEPHNMNNSVRLQSYIFSQKVEGEVASVTDNAVWNKSRDIRDCIRISKLAKSVEDVEFVVDTFLSNDRKIDE